MALGDLSRQLSEAKRKTRLSGRNVSAQEASGIAAGAAAGASERLYRAKASDIAQQGIDVQREDIASRELMQQAGFGHQTGMQQAGFGHQTSMQEAEFGHQTSMQQAGIESQEGMQAAGIESTEGMQAAAIESQEGMQAAAIESQEGMQGAGFEHELNLQINDIAAKYGLQAADLELSWAQFEAATDIKDRTLLLDAWATVEESKHAGSTINQKDKDILNEIFGRDIFATGEDALSPEEQFYNKLDNLF